ncbi:type VII secretion protein EccB [Solwaraspora sp. WMMA2080]|uniref:type VII secretion protein EccB n=1 Tax=Solwaraspora sp. WMMA2059 TaxID=3015160 RepID=UPI00248C517A|nr:MULTISPECIES: type VII secretion protein EccB [unclassified Solwaraspora]WBB95679.1 type VII secretion protein EccB [Solwaraspora sp. WMMA2059]WBC20418.1 type VII secretion protein EccB [Solwaraspora sp. WMMA2080]
MRPAAGDSAPPASPPATPPALIRPATGDTLCAVTSDARTVPTITSVGGTVAGLDEAVPTDSVTRDGVILADYVLVPPGRVAVVRVFGAPTADTGPYYVVTDLGIKFPVPNATVLGQLGYSATQATDVPTTLVSRIPTGPTLDPSRPPAPPRRPPPTDTGGAQSSSLPGGPGSSSSSRRAAAREPPQSAGTSAAPAAARPTVSARSAHSETPGDALAGTEEPFLRRTRPR